MKTSPFLVACTFLLGCLTALAAIATLREPAHAAAESSAMGSAGIKDFQALTINVDANRSFLVVFKEVKNLISYTSDKEEGLNDMDMVTGMAIYEITTSSGVALKLVATRYIDYDVRYFQYNSAAGGKMGTDVQDMKNAIIGLIKSKKKYDEDPKKGGAKGGEKKPE